MQTNNFILNLLESFRLSITIPAAFLVCLGYKLSELPTNWMVFWEILLISSATMLTNDYIDRENDAHRKQKSFALNNHFVLLPIIIVMWSIAFSISLFTFSDFGSGNILLLLCIIVGILYSYTRKIILVPTILVALTSAAPLLFGFVENQNFSALLGFLSVALLIFGREILKDGIDIETDAGYKKTIFTAGWVNEENVITVTAIFILLGIVVNMALSLELTSSRMFFYTVGVIFIFFFLCRAWIAKRSVSFEKLKNIIDGGTCMMLASLLL